MPPAAFDPTQPVDRPVPELVPLASSGVWDLEQLRRFELTAAPGRGPGSTFAAAVRADALLRASHVLDSLLASGCDELHIDFDTLGPAGDLRAARLAALVDELRERGLQIHGAFTLGLDHDDPGCFERLVEWVEARGLAHVELRLWTPDPGSDRVRELARADRIRHRDLRRWDGAHVVVTPAQMSAQTLYRGWVWARRRLSAPASIWRRRPRRLAELPRFMLTMAWTVLAPLQARARARRRMLPARPRVGGASDDLAGVNPRLLRCGP